MKEIGIGLVVGGIIIGICGGILFISQRPKEKVAIKTFGECVRAGFPVEESDPRVCMTPDGTRFEEERVGAPGVGL